MEFDNNNSMSNDMNVKSYSQRSSQHENKHKVKTKTIDLRELIGNDEKIYKRESEDFYKKLPPVPQQDVRFRNTEDRDDQSQQKPMPVEVDYGSRLMMSNSSTSYHRESLDNSLRST